MNKAEILALFASLLGQPATSTEADLTAHIKTLSAAPAPFDSKPLLDKIETLSTEVKGLKDKLTTSETAAQNAEKANIVALFASQGKAPVNPKTGKAFTIDALSALDTPALQVLLANTPVTVPLSARGKETTQDGKTAKLGASGRAARIEAELGLPK